MYFNQGLYLKAYEGSFIEMLFFDDKRFSVGEYLKIGCGLGYKYSPEFKHLDDNGFYSAGMGGVYGNEEIKVPGPVEKGRFGYLVDLNYGIQTRYKFDPEEYPMRSIGFRWYYAIHINPILHHRDPVYPNGYFFNGAKTIYYTHENFSAALEWSFKMGDKKQSHHRFCSLTFRKHKENDYGKYIGLRLDYIGNPVNPDLAPAYFQVNAFNIQLLFGRAIF